VRNFLRSSAAVVRQWPRVIAESLGWRPDSTPMEAAAGSLPEVDAWQASKFGACWLGQATVLLRIGGTTVLTDPHFGQRAGITLGADRSLRIGRRRCTALPGEVHQLPPIDVIALSHAHFDHWDRPSLEMLAEHGAKNGRSPVVVIPTGTRRLLPSAMRHGARVVELDWDQQREVDDLELRAIRPNHWGARWWIDRHRGYNAYLIESTGRRLLFGGDTAHTDAFDCLSEAGGVNMAVLGIGTYERWEHRHATPEQAADMATRMGARLLLPIHHSTFRDPSEPIDEPLQRLLRVWDPGRIVCGRIGEFWQENGLAA